MAKGGKVGVGDGGKGGGTGGGAPAGQSKKLCQVFLRNLPLTMLEPVSGGLGLVARVDHVMVGGRGATQQQGGADVPCCCYISVM